MSFKKNILVIVSILFFGIGGYAQSFTNMGKEFWVGYGHHQYMEQGYDNSQEMVLYICTHEQAATVTVKLEGSGIALPPPLGGPWTRTYTIPANTVVSIEDPMPVGVTVTKSPNSISAIGPIPKGAAGQGGFDARLLNPPPPIGNGGDGLFKKKGIHITSTAPIVVYAHIYGSVSSGATMLMPVETWGYNYTSLNSAQRNADNAYSWIYVIAKENNTRVVITPSVITRTNDPAGVPITVDLQKGEIYQVIGALVSATDGLELTGTTVKSIDNGTGVCYPVAVFAGSSRTGGESDCWQGSGRDNDMQQMFPQEAWGRKYLTAPFSNSGDPASLMINMYKVAVKDPATVVKRNGIVLTGLKINKYYYFESNTADYIEASEPVMVAEYMSGGSPCANGDGDPEMVYLSPIEQAISNVGFYRNTRESINVNYLTLIIPTAGVNTLKIDGTSFGAILPANKFSYPHPNLPGYTVCIRRWPSEKAQTFVQSDSNFTAITYGLGGAESYAYNAGTYINNLNARTLIHNVLDTTKRSNNFTCTNSNVDLSVLIAYKPSQIKWQMSYVTDLQPPTGDIVSGNGTDIIVAEDSIPVDGKMFYKYSVPGNPYRFGTIGTYNIPYSAKNPGSDLCDPFERFFLDVVVKAKPVADFSIVQTACASDGVNFTANATGNGYTINQWYWEFLSGVPGKDSIQKPVYTFPVSDSSYPVKLTVVSEDGCPADTVKNVIVPPGISTSFAISANAACEGGSVSITPGPETTTEWYWFYGDGSSDTLTNGNAFTHTYNDPGNYTIRHTIKGSGSCNSDTASKPFTVYAKPFTTFSISPLGCLPADGIVTFTSTAFAPDGQAINANSHLWDFGNKTSSQPTTSNTYSIYGTYPVHYRVSTVNGCANDTLVNAVFNVRPLLAYASPAEKDICATDAPFTLSTVNVTNGVPGTGYYKGTAVTDKVKGTYDPTLATYGVDTVWYIFTSDGGCTDSVFTKLNVHAKPHPAFSYTTGCLPAGSPVVFTNSSTIPTAVPMTYSWEFGDLQNAPTDNTSVEVSPSHNYKAEGTFSIKLSAVANGCPADTVVNAVFSIQPALAAAVVNGVCESDLPYALTFGSVTNGVTGTQLYRGTGIIDETAGIFDPSIAGATPAGSPHKIWFVFTTTGGCVDSISQAISVSAKPHPAFTYTIGCLPVGSPVVFTNNSTIATGVPLAYSWNFGDSVNAPASNTSADVTPSHNYKTEGAYKIKLSAIANGCSGDTTINAVFSLQPALAAAPVPGVCESALPYALTFGSVTNGVTGTPLYQGPGITNSATATFDPSIAGGGAHKISYVFTTTGGCVDSIAKTILVYERPTGDFSINNNRNDNICLDSSALLSSRSVISTGTIKGWSWSFSNGDQLTYSNGDPFIKSFAASGDVNVNLIVTSDSGCTSIAVNKTIHVRPLPVAGFTSASVICLPDTSTQFINTSTIPDQTALNYQWNFGDNTPSLSTVSPVHIFNGAAPQSLVTLHVTSAYGCISDTAKTINFYSKPIADFSAAPDTLCQGAQNFFTDLSTAPNSNITTRSWNFGDGSSPSASANPIITYTNPGNYNIRLSVTNAQGCTADTVKTVTVFLQPKIDAGPSFLVPEGDTVTFNPIVNSSDVTFLWTPGFGLSNPSALRPTLKALLNQTYTLTATGLGSCKASDTLQVKVMRPIHIPNAFSPNGDGINDTWVLTHLQDYPNSIVEVYNRYGKPVFTSIGGYQKSWDGTFSGSALPVGTYYYVINLKDGSRPYAGYVAIIK